MDHLLEWQPAARYNYNWIRASVSGVRGRGFRVSGTPASNPHRASSNFTKNEVRTLRSPIVSGKKEVIMIQFAEIRVGEPLHHRSLTVFPLFCEVNRRVDYLLSDEAMEAGTVSVQ